MDLRKNPFLLLHLSPREDKTSILEQFDKKSAEGIIDEHVLMSAQSQLMVSKSRLIAEISWLPNLNPQKAREIADFVISSNFIKLSESLITLEGLSRANVASYLCSEKKGTKEVLNHLCEAQSQFDFNTILNDVNCNRSLAGFPLVDIELIKDSISRINTTHAEVAMAYITTTKHPGNFFTSIIEKYYNDPAIAKFIEDIAEKYESWVTAKLRDYENQINDHVDKKEQWTSIESSIDQITEVLKSWDEYSQPLQLIYQAKGLTEKRSKKLYQEMRVIYLWLVNKQNNPELSLKFALSLQKIFRELPSEVASLQNHINVLESRVQGKSDKALFDLFDKFNAVMEDLDSFCKSVILGNFQPNGSGVAGEFYQEFIKAVKKTKGKEHEDIPWLILIKLVEYFTIIANRTTANKILLALEKASPPNRIKNKMAPYIKANNKSLKKETHDYMLKPIIYFGIFLLILLIIVISALYDSFSSNSFNSPSKNETTTSILQKESNTTNFTPENAVTNSSLQIETKPPIGTNQVLNLSELRYCKFQDIRLSYIYNQFPSSNNDQNNPHLSANPKLGNEMVDKYNELVEDYNSRCSRNRFYVNDQDTIQQEISSNLGKLEKEAQIIIDQWNRNFTFE